LGVTKISSRRLSEKKPLSHRERGQKAFLGQSRKVRDGFKPVPRSIENVFLVQRAVFWHEETL
jgi:hypothetical protein